MKISEMLTVQQGEPVYFTTGAFIAPIKLIVNGVEVWRWVVESFEGDSFYDGEVHNPREYAFNAQALIEEEEFED